MSARLPHLDFQYRRPSPNFDDSQVKGVVANLITVKDHKHFAALDTVAGGRVSGCFCCLSSNGSV